MAIKAKIDGRTIVFTTSLGDSYTFNVEPVSTENQDYAVMHGFKQRLVDNAAIGRDSASGRSATDEEKMAEIRALGNFYMSGAAEWTVRGTPGERGGLVLRSVAALQGLSVEEMSTRIDKLAEKRGESRKKLLAGLAARPDVKAKMDELRPVDKTAPLADSLLDELSGLDESGEEDELGDSSELGELDEEN